MIKRMFAPAFLAAAVLIAAALPVQAFYIAVSPTKFDYELSGRPVTDAIKLLNRSDKPVTVNVKVNNWEMDKANKVKVIPPTKQSLDRWIVIRPSKVVIPPGKTRTIRFAIRPFANPTPGEHRAIIYLEQHVAKGKPVKGLNTRFRLGLAVYGYAGPRNRVAKFHGLEGGAKALALDIESKGNAHVRTLGKYAIWPAKAFPGDVKAKALLSAFDVMNAATKPKSTAQIGVLAKTPVLPGTRRKVSTSFGTALKAGSYRAVLSGKIGNKPFSRVHTFTVGN